MSSAPRDTPGISPLELAGLLEAGEPFQILDIRAPQRVAQGRIDLLPENHFHNIRGSMLLTLSSLAATGLDPNLPVVVVCGRGRDSAIAVAHLDKLGATASSLTGGLAEWMRLTLPRDLDAPEGLDALIQFDRIGSGCLGYLLVSKGEALIIDPPLAAGAYLDAVRDAGAKLVGVADTHIHADYVSGAVELSRDFSVPYYLHPADAVYPYDGTQGRIEFSAIADGDVIPFGEAAIRVVHTPGHTEGSVTYLCENRVAFTGDFLFVESIGRPDLAGMESVWAGHLWESVRRAVREWDPGLAIYPAHYASPTERRMGQAVGVPFGALKQENEYLRLGEKEDFLRKILARSAPFPEAYRKIKALNLGLAPIVQTEVEEVEVGRNECALGGV
jgi:glyoxylase-like metal-dependent hydrolase (beta-lactamase superfamily II)/rhodanese-related sulfurtransferase